jgi:hypothetical protein
MLPKVNHRPAPVQISGHRGNLPIPKRGNTDKAFHIAWLRSRILELRSWAHVRYVSQSKPSQAFTSILNLDSLSMVSKRSVPVLVVPFNRS